MVESPFQTVLRCFENVLRRNVPTSSSKEPDVGTFLYNTREHRGYLFACVYGKEPATPLDIVSRVPGAPLAAHTYVRRLEDHQFRAHRAVQTQLGRALQRTSCRYGDEKDAIQPGEKVWLFTSKSAADRKLAIPYSGPWKSDQTTVRHAPDHPARGGLVPSTQKTSPSP